MSFRTTVAGWLSPKTKASETQEQERSELFGPIGDLVSISSPWWNVIKGENLTQPYANHPAVHACARAIGRNLGQLEFNFYVETNRGGGGLKRFQEARINRNCPPGLWHVQDPVKHFRAGELEKVYNHDFNALFQTINPLQDPATFWELNALHMMLHGECDVVAEERESLTDMPSELWPHDPRLFTLIDVTSGGLPKTWMYQPDLPNAKPTEVPDLGLIRPRIPNPYNMLRGLPPIEAARVSMNSDWKSMLFNEAFYDNMGQLGNVYTSPHTLTQKQEREFLDKIKGRHGGVFKAFKDIFLGGGVTVNPAPIPHKEAEFLNQRTANKEEIAMVFGVSESEINGWKDLNFATALAQDRSFWQKTMIPLINFLESVYYWGLFQYFEGGRIFGAFNLQTVEALQDDLMKKAEIAEKLTNMNVPFRDVNERLGLGFPDQPWYGTPLVNLNVVPINDVISGETLKMQKSQANQSGGQGKKE